MMRRLDTALIAMSMVISMSSWALVDYSEDSGEIPSGMSKVSKNIPETRSVKSISRSERRMDPFKLATRYDSVSLDTQGAKNKGVDGKVDIASVALHIPTPVSVFFDFAYWQGSSTNPDVAPSSYQKGNPKALIGFNWLQLGGPADAVRADVYGGASFRATNSALGSSRNDQIYGMTTSKRFYDVVLMLGGEYVIPSKAYAENDLNIGAITKLSAALGWVVSNDIRIAVEGVRTTVKAKPSDSTSDSPEVSALERRGLESNLTFSAISPHLYLGIAPMLELELGGSFRTQKAENSSTKDGQNLIDAKLFDYTGSYGNSIFAALHLSV